MKTFFIVLVCSILVVAFSFLIKLIFNNIREEKLKKDQDNLATNNMAITPLEFFEVRKQQKGFTGVYIIYNETKDLVYVGQGQNVFNRVNNHFTGKGNGDIYADYKYGDNFKIGFVSLVNSNYNNLDDLERYYIDLYDAIALGYNKNRGIIR